MRGDGVGIVVVIPSSSMRGLLRAPLLWIPAYAGMTWWRRNDVVARPPVVPAAPCIPRVLASLARAPFAGAKGACTPYVPPCRPSGFLPAQE